METFVGYGEMCWQALKLDSEARERWGMGERSQERAIKIRSGLGCDPAVSSAFRRLPGLRAGLSQSNNTATIAHNLADEREDVILRDDSTGSS
jgi:hypothetical protein